MGRRVEDCPIQVEGKILKENFMILDMNEFDVIIGMDWMHRNQVQIDCRKRTVAIPDSSGKSIYLQEKERSTGKLQISALEARKLECKGCSIFIACIEKAEEQVIDLNNVPVIQEYSDVFPDDLNMPPTER
jgi:hypothetical protein